MDRDQPTIPEPVVDWIAAGRPEPPPRAVGDWLAAAPGRRALCDELGQAWARTAAPASAAPDLEDLRRRVGEATPERPARRQPSRRSRRAARRPARTRGLRAAAAVALLVGGGALGLHAGRSWLPAPNPASLAVPAGATSTVEFDDGSIIRVNSATRLTYSRRAGGGTRVVLDGEAFFAVPDGADRSFEVHTAAGVVRDIGTEFNVRARDDGLTVAVVDGAVELTAAARTIRVREGEVARATAGRPPAPVRDASPAMATAWLDGDYAFIDQPLAEIAAEIERRQAITIAVAPELRNIRVTARIASTEDAAAAVRAICMAVGAECSGGGRDWRMTP